MGTWALRLLRQYWYRLVIVEISSDYYRKTFKWYRGFTQGYPLSPTIFNVLVNTVLHHWVT